jgi:photosystem II stability/assembly factor-like uncharacterized protein
MNRIWTWVAAVGMATATVLAQGGTGGQAQSDAFEGLAFRSIGPSLTTGRISDISVDPKNRNVWYVAVSSGNLWKTENRGNTWTPIFDTYGSYSLGVVVVDPKDSNVVWLGTGENNNQRSVAFGDGVYKSTDAGKTWARVGLENSEHIGEILLDPRDSNVVYVAAIGPLWSAGGDRGLYKTTDAGKTWKAVLTISPDTGVTDIAMDPKRPDVIYAAALQRRRAVGQLIGGGPESGLYKTTNGGQTWNKLTKGLPAVEIGRIGLGVNWRNPNTVYALVTAQRGQGGFFRSDDGGSSWTRIGRIDREAAGGRGGPQGGNQQPPAPCAALGAAPPPAPAESQPTQGRGGRGGGPADDCYRGGDPGYYNEIIVDGHDPETIWSPQTQMYVSRDGGKTWRQAGFERTGMHVDHHDIVFDPTDRNHFLVGNDGGLYETYDGGTTFRHFTNLPLSQFYRVAVDNARPFYHVCGGTQDNGTHCGPSRTRNRVGIRTSDWFVSGGGDGFQPRMDPEDPNTFYATSQNGSLNRLDLRSGRSQSIRPRPSGDQDGQAGGRGGQGGGRGGQQGRWHWDAPYIISPHASRRLYFGGERLYRSDDRGDNWTPVSADLTRNLDRTKLPIMGKVWPPDSVALNQATTTLSTITTIDESPLMEGLLYVGTDDGLIQVSEDAGKAWRKLEKFPGLPEYAYVTDLFASTRDANTVFATFNNYQRGDFKPYVYKSTDRGRTWTSIAGDLPQRSGAWSIVQDHLDSDLLFAGLEFGVYFTVDGGQRWTQLKGGIPAIQARDLHIQRRENDLVVGTFGRGAYILDDYSPLRGLSARAMTEQAHLLPLRDAYMYDELGQQRAAWGNLATPNPPYGAVFTYHLAKPPSGDAKLVLTIADDEGKPVRRLDLPTTTGIQRIAWNLRADPPAAEQGQGAEAGRGGGRGGRGGGGGRGGPPQGPPVDPGRYRATLGTMTGEIVTPLGEAQTFMVVPLPR